MTFRRDRLRPVAFLAPLLIAISACQEAAPERSPLERARAELAAGNGVAADIVLRGELESGAAREDLAAWLGEAALASGDLAEARKWLGDGDFSAASGAHGFRMLGRLELLEGNLAAAGQAFDRALAAGSQDPELWVDIGRLRYRGGEQLQALDAAERAVALGPDNAAALQFRGQLARDAEGLESAIQWFARAVEKRPNDTALRADYAATLGDAGRAREALAVLRVGDGRAAATPQGLYVQAVVATRGGNALLARELLVRSESDDFPAAALLSALIDLEAENYSSAAQQLDRLYREQPDNRRVANLLAYALSKSGGERELVRRFAPVARSARGSSYLRLLVGRAFEALGERGAAAGYLDSAAGRRAKFSALASATPAEILRTGTGGDGLDTRDYVRHAIGEGRTGAAVDRARAFAGRFPGSGDAFVMLGDAEYAAGNTAAARAAYARSARIRRPWPLTIKLYDTHARPAEARALLENEVRNNPMNGEALAALADAYAAEGQWERSARLLDHAMRLGMGRVPWVLAARSVAARELGDSAAALDFALAAHDLQPMNPAAVAALIAAFPEDEIDARQELADKLRSLTAR